MLWRFAIAAVISAVLAASGGFDGKWVIDRSSTGDEPVPVHLVQKMKTNGSEIEVESTFAEPAGGVVPLLYVGIMAGKLTLASDGSERQNQIGPFQQASKTTLDGSTMATDWTAVIKGEPVQGKWVRTLSPDGRAMTLEIQESSKGVDHRAMLKFRRQ